MAQTQLQCNGQNTIFWGLILDNSTLILIGVGLTFRVGLLTFLLKQLIHLMFDSLMSFVSH